MYLLYRLFEDIANGSEEAEGDDGKESHKSTTFVMQDYNALVLRLVTLPNILLAWCEFLPSLSFRLSY